MKEEIAKMLEKGFMLICIVTAFCMTAMIAATAYYLVRDRNFLFCITAKCLFTFCLIIGIYGIYKGIKFISAWLDR